jgi:amino acid adenylation domain-containing protein
LFNKNDLEDRKSNLSAAKRALLESRIKGKIAADKLPKQGIPRRQQANHVPLSFAQQRLWFLNQLEPDSPYYNIPTAVRLKGDVRQDLLERAINEIVRRHESLRTTFASFDDEPVQVIAPELFVPLEYIDLRDVSDSEREKAAEGLAFQEAGKAFNIVQGPLIRALIARLAAQDYLLFMNVHHIVTDGWSSNVMVTEIAAVYDALLSGKPSPLPELLIQYPDFAVWQRNYLQGEVLDKQVSYWKKQLGGSLPVLQLPTDRPRPAVQTFNGDALAFTLEKALIDQVKAVATDNNASMFMVLLSAFNTLMYRYTGQEDLLVGTPIANRNRGEVEGLIGFFANTLVLRTAMRDDMTFRELIAQVRQVSLDAYAHQDFPFERLVEELQPERNMSTSALFQVMFIYQKNQWIKFERETMTIEPMEVTSKTSKFDLSLFTLEGPDVVEAVFEYNTDLFDRSTIVRMKEQMLRILTLIVADLDVKLADIPLLSEAERQKLLVEWNQTDVTYRKDLCVHQMFEAQVERTPDAVAVTYQGQSLSYHALNERANQLAGTLRELGARPDVAVGICMERSLEMVVGVVAILKAGGSYVSLDPNYPEDRLAFMLADTQVPVLITHSSLADRFATQAATVLCLDAERETLAAQRRENLPNVSNPESLAYILYTSGSTGKPKGVEMTHDVVVNMLHWQLDATVIKHGARTMQFASLNFDVSFQEIFTTLCSGGHLLIVEEEVRRDPVRLLRFLDEEAVERIFLPFVAFQQLAEVASSASTVPHALREIITAGEQLQVSRQIVKWLSQTADVVVHNQYGPSESHVVTAFTLSGLPKKWPALPPIGRPITGAHIYLLDARLHPVPIGVPGEMYIGGQVLARGYLQRPDLTQERFLPNPFVDDSAARMYKTGDMARYLPDGTIEFLGRADDQVKIRGYRVELGEIENVLTQHTFVREAAVQAREDVPGDKRLVAYLVVDKQTLPDSSQLRKFLLARLPEYMVPSAFVFLDALPLTPSGKLDRRALPEPERDREDLKRTYVAPRNPVEEVLATVWAEVLRLEQVGVMDNFFELGGHSLLATQVVSRIKVAFDVELPLRKLFEAPTVADLALAVEQASHIIAAPPIVQVSRDQALPLSFAQERLWFFEQLQPGTATYNLPNILRLDGKLNADALERTCNEIICRHESLRTGFDMVAGQPVQVIREEMQVKLQMIDLTPLPEREREDEAKRVAKLEAERPFNILQDDLVRGMLLCLDETEHVLIINIHHICSDGWSMGVMVQELAAIYGAFVNDRPSPLRPLPIQYADFSVWQRNWLSGEVLDEQMSYWKDQLGGEVPILQLPTDHPRPAARSFRGGDEMFTLPAALTKRLHQLAQREGVTMYMLLLATFNVLMHRYSGQDDILVGSPIANRNRGEIEGLIGFFVNTLVMRSDLSGNPSFQEVLKRVRKTTIDAYAHQDLPFEKLVEELQPERNMSTSALFQVLFVLQNAPMGSLDLPGLSISPWNISSGTSKFDLSIYMVEEEGMLTGALEYNADLFEHDTMLRVIEHFKQLLSSIVAEPERAITELPLLSEAEQRKVLVEFNDTKTSYPRTSALHHLFEEQAASYPESVALVFGDAQLTYRELNERANRLARHLQKLGVGPDMLVGICAERSFEMVVGLLGILKAGGAYVPLDPNYPTERLAHMISDANVSVLVAHEHLLAHLPEHGAQVVLLDAECDGFANERSENTEVAVTGEHVAYVMYTSGSTGTPKGVVIPQQGVVRLVKETDYVEFGACHVFLQFAPISFDAATFEIWGALLNGAKLVIAPPGKLSLEELGDVLVQHRITTLWLTAGLFHQMVEGHLAALQHVRQLLAGGDVLSPVHVKKVLEQVPGIVVVNGYGPTESTTFATCHVMQDVSHVGTSVSIGQPIANTQVYVLDTQRQPVPLGVPGELYIAGDGLARGYLNLPELSAERFLPNPFAGEAGVRMYQTGDLVRYLPDGTLEFLGRIDGQVKIRGFRIEPGEIEAALELHPQVREAVVIAREDVPGDKRLVAYAVQQEADAVSVSEMRHFLKNKLPEHLLPSSIVFMDRFPLSPNGKVDRRALPAPDTSRQVDSEYVAPSTETELLVAAIWQEVLGVAQVGVTDDFFEMGGHSLLATQLLSRLRNTFQVELPLRVLFEAPTVANLALQIEQTTQSNQRMQIVRTKTLEDGRREYPLSFAQQRLWFLDQLGPGNAAYNIAFAFRLAGPLQVDALTSCLQTVVARHESLRTTFVEGDDQPIQRVAPHVDLQIPILDLRELDAADRAQEIKRMSELHAQTPFDLKQGPLLRVTMLQVSDLEHVLLLNMHHIVSDGWSMGVLIGEVSAMYQAQIKGLPNPLPELTLHYGDFSVWQRHYLQGDVLEEQMAYWKAQFAEPVTALTLPTDRQRPTVQTYNGATTLIVISPELTAKLNKLCQQEGTTMYMTLLAALNTLFYRYSGQEDIVIGSPIANRNHAEIEGLIGFFVNTIAMRTDLSGNPSFRDLLTRVRNTAMDAYGHQDLPFEMLIEALQIDRDMSPPAVPSDVRVAKRAELEPHHRRSAGRYARCRSRYIQIRSHLHPV